MENVVLIPVLNFVPSHLTVI